jgi:dolichyl-phosphate-mannose--protein O-mannosyl transferase
LAVATAAHRFARKREQPSPELRTYGLLLLTAALLLLQWYFTNRESYIWHYLVSYYFGVLLLVGWLTSKLDERPWPVVAFIGVVAVVSVFYAPAWSNAPMTEAAFQMRFFPWQR